MKKQKPTTLSEQTTEQTTAPIMNEQPNAEQTTPTEVVDPFAGLTATASTNRNSKKLPFTQALQDKARGLAIELIDTAKGHPTLAPLANSMLRDKTPEALHAFIKAGIDQDDLYNAAFIVLADCPTDDLPKMLESQRSNRSKAKKTGLTAMTQVVTYVSSMVAELMIRFMTGKAYAVGGGKLETDHAKLAADKEMLTKRINSLASKQSRLRPLAQYDAAAATKLAEVEAELAELRAMRPGKSKTTVKSVSVDQVKAAISSGAIDQATLQALLDMMKANGQTEQAEQAEEQAEAQTEQALPNELGA